MRGAGMWSNKGGLICWGSIRRGLIDGEIRYKQAHKSLYELVFLVKLI